MNEQNALAFFVVVMSVLAAYFLAIEFLTWVVFFGFVGINSTSIEIALQDDGLWAGLGFLSAAYAGFAWRHSTKKNLGAAEEPKP